MSSMNKRKIDNRIRVLLENGAIQGHRTLVVVVGDKSIYQTVFIHHMLSKASLKQASVLWCYKRQLLLSSNQKKRKKQIEERKRQGCSANEDDPFEMFVSMTEINYCYYKDTHRILGNTYKMCVIQDFEAITPNILCRTIETVEGGGVIVVLLQSLTSLRQLYTLNMDVHARYRTEAHQHVVPRFNERFILSLGSCNRCMVVDDLLRILPVSSHLRDLQPVPASTATQLSPEEKELKDLKETLEENPPIGLLVKLCKTLDQAKAVLQFVMAITEKTLRTTVTLTAGRGRGKSAALGLAMAGAIAFGYSNIFVTSPSPENIRTLFEFLLKGLNEIGYEEILNYHVLRSSDPKFNKCVMRITVFREHRQVIQYIAPGESKCLGQAEIVVIDEAAAIPLPLVRELMGPYLVFLSSTISGYEGTGRSLSLKLIDQLREQSKDSKDENKKKDHGIGRVLHEVTLDESIRYKNGDPVEKWLHHILCLEASLSSLPKSLPAPQNCELFFVNRDTLFGYHKVSEKFLEQVTGLLVASHYRNTPDDLQILSDAPAHHLFVLISNQENIKEDQLPTILCVIQVALEGKISKASVMSAISEQNKPAGDLIPWTVSNQYQNYDFPQLSGLRVVRIATHPHVQSKGYGSRAMELLENYYTSSAIRADYDATLIPETTQMKLVKDEDVGLLEEKLGPNSNAAPLLQALNERPAEALHYFGVSYGASSQLLTFWKRQGFTVVYLSQVSNPLTGEHTAIMLKVLGEEKSARSNSWLRDFWADCQRRLLNLLPGAFRDNTCKFALSLITNTIYKNTLNYSPPSLEEINLYTTADDLKRMEEFVNHQCDAAFIIDILPSLAKLYFLGKFYNFKLKPVHAAILCGMGSQRKNAGVVAAELGVERGIVMSEMHKLMNELTQQLRELRKSAITEPSEDVNLSLAADVEAIVKETAVARFERELDDREKVAQLIDVEQFGIMTTENEIAKSKKAIMKKKKLNRLINNEPKKKKVKDNIGEW